jgi:UDP-2-acetamido-3-amino-2,3-dideoxy-glucuronate N-acetyltransferase
MSEIHATANVASGVDAPGLRVGAFAVVEGDVRLGQDVRVGAQAVLARGCRVGDRVTVADAAVIGPGAVIENDVAVGANATVATSSPGAGATTIVRSGVRIGAGALVGEGAEVGEGAVVGDGAVVRRQVPRHAVVAGNPAVITGYSGPTAGTVMEPVRQVGVDDGATGIQATGVRGVGVHRLPQVRDLRGSLVAGELGHPFPFTPNRYFLVFDVPSEEVRGEHAHYVCHQLLVCVAGHLHVIADDGHARAEFVLDDKRTGLHLPPMTWGIQYRYSSDCVLMVLASHVYDAADYIRDYDVFLAEARRTGAEGREDPGS